MIRYLSHVMSVATPTKDCLELVNELLDPIMKAKNEKSLTRQEVRLSIYPYPNKSNHDSQSLLKMRVTVRSHVGWRGNEVFLIKVRKPLHSRHVLKL